VPLIATAGTLNVENLLTFDFTERRECDRMSADRAKALDLIKRNIEKSGFHIYLVAGGGRTPRFVYTIGLRESLGAELVLAGALYYEDKDETSE
jgi:hypothetical protein